MTVQYVGAPHLVARAAGATVLIMGGTTLAHTWAGGALPAVPALMALAAAVYGIGLLVLRSTVRLSLVLPVMLVAQTCLHGMFGLLGTAHAGHAHLGEPAVVAQWGWQMLVAHAVGTILAALVWWLCQRAADLVVDLLRWNTAYLRGRRDVGPTVPRKPFAVGLVCLVGAPRRGPPVGIRLA
jgi:hypothetical protein